jgi:hypothetical protein
MNELVDLIVKKTGVSAATATTIVNIVLNYATKKLPAPIATELTTLINNEAVVSEAESLIGGLAATLEKNAANKKKK